jgi:hypothetical protein
MQRILFQERNNEPSRSVEFVDPTPFTLLKSLDDQEDTDVQMALAHIPLLQSPHFFFYLPPCGVRKAHRTALYTGKSLSASVPTKHVYRWCSSDQHAGCL